MTPDFAKSLHEWGESFTFGGFVLLSSGFFMEWLEIWQKFLWYFSSKSHQFQGPARKFRLLICSPCPKGATYNSVIAPGIKPISIYHRFLFQCCILLERTRFMYQDYLWYDMIWLIFILIMFLKRASTALRFFNVIFYFND